MAILSREVKNKKNSDGIRTGRTGTVYDVNLKYKRDGKWKAYSKKGFITKKDAENHEIEMKKKLSIASFSISSFSQGKKTLKEYLETWVEQHGKANLRPSTFASYKGHIKNHIIPAIGHIELRALTSEKIDEMLSDIREKGLSESSIRYAQRILSVALEQARKYRYIEQNPAKDILTKFGKGGKTPDPYTVAQMQQLISHTMGTEWEMLIVLGAMYGLRLSEILGLRWQNIDIEKNIFNVMEQLPFGLKSGTTIIEEMAPLKNPSKAEAEYSKSRILPITDATRQYFIEQHEMKIRQKDLAKSSGIEYFDNNLVVSKSNGAPLRRDGVSNKWGQFIRRLGMPHIRFHDLRHTAATNMHQLTGDFYTVGEILGHTLKGIGLTLGISTNLEAVTARYVDVRLERKKEVLDIYHNALYPSKSK